MAPMSSFAIPRAVATPAKSDVHVNAKRSSSSATAATDSDFFSFPLSFFELLSFLPLSPSGHLSCICPTSPQPQHLPLNPFFLDFGLLDFVFVNIVEPDAFPLSA